MMAGEIPTSELFKCRFGIFRDNQIISPDDSTFNCVSYQYLRERMEGIPGFHNLKWEEDIQSWVCFQFLPYIT